MDGKSSDNLFNNRSSNEQFSISGGFQAGDEQAAPPLIRRYCNNCGAEINGNSRENAKGIVSGYEKESSASHVVSGTASSKCSRCEYNFCSSCLTYQKDEDTGKDYFLCNSCLKKYNQLLKEVCSGNVTKAQAFQGFDGEIRNTGSRRKNILSGMKIITFLALTSIIGLLLSGSVISFFIPDMDQAEAYEVLSSPSGVGMKRTGEPVVLVDNEQASNCSWYDLVIFLKKDETDELLYANNSFECTDFAERLHNNAEKAGIRAAYVIVHFRDVDSSYTLNAFETTDEGLVFIDCMGSCDADAEESIDFDKIAYVEKGEVLGLLPLDYTADSDYEYYLKRKDQDLYNSFLESGTVSRVNIYWSA